MRLYIMQVGMFPGDNVPVPGYLIQTDDGKNVLIDSGCPLGMYQGEGLSVVFETGREDFQIEANQADSIVNRLAALGLKPEDIDILICSHLDWDHAGAHDLFTGARLIVQRKHYQTALSGQHHRFEVTRSIWDAPGLHYELIDGDKTLLPRIELIETDGHVPGHQSILVRLPKTGAVLLPVDAIQSSDRIDPERREISPAYDMNEAAVRASTRKLAAIVARDKVALTVFGHDAAQWKTLRKSPEFYE